MSARALKTLAGIIWLAVGIRLAWKGFSWLLEHGSTPGIVTALVVGGVIGGAKGRFVLSKSARRNSKRIEGLEAPRPWNVFTLRFAVLIGIMIGFGIGLRAMADAGWLSWMFVGGLYVGIGAALCVSALVYWTKEPPPYRTRTDACPAPDDARTGVLIVNLGTPDAPDPASVRRYLREFLGDPSVIEVNRVLWTLLLNLIILPIRGRKSAEAYSEVWDDEHGSPLLRYTNACADALRERLDERWRVAVGMRYGKPGLEPALRELQAEGCRRIVVLPLYPQYSNTTTGTTQARVSEIVSTWRDQPALTFVPPFPDHDGYIKALAARIREASPTPPDFHVFSFHGLPEKYVRKGDPYVDQCARTSWALARELGLQRDQWEMIFQSRFGSQPWLQPYLDEYVPGLAGRYERLLVTTPGFAADCLETIEEVGMELRELYEEAGGGELIVVPCLNDHPLWIDAVEALVTDGCSVPAAT